MLTRRDLLKSLPIAAASTLLARQLASIGAELYTVRDVLPKKPAETLNAIQAIGYREIEAQFADLDKIWAAVQATHLRPASCHLRDSCLDPGQEDELAHAVDRVKSLGFAFAVFPFVQPAKRGGLEITRVFCDKLNRAGEKCRAAGLGFAYHNHSFEFEPVEGTEPMKGTTRFQLMLDRLDKNLCGFELDCFWVSVSGNDPVEVLKKLSGRVPLLHLKDKAAGTPVLYTEAVKREDFKEVGHGTIDWPAVLRAAAASGVQHYFVEQDQTPGDPIESLRQSFAYVSKLQY